MGSRYLRTVLGEALTGIARNGLLSLAAATTVAVSLFVLAVFLLVLVNGDHLARTVESGLEVRVYLRDGLGESERDELRSALLGLPGVSDVVFVSKTEALAALREQLGEDADLLEGIDEMNPLRDSFRVTTQGPAWVDSVAAAARSLPGVEDVGYTHDLAQRILKLTTSLRLGGLVLICLMILATLFVISNTVRLTIFARSEEIAIMKLVGATNWFVRWPFIFEGLLLGLAGALLAAVAAWQTYSWAVGGVYANVSFIPVLPVYPLTLRLGLFLLGLGALVGALGSVLSLRRFLSR
ncbi:MAG: permease-like cell division protein FtsX [Firmicutes bacterium]|nr:permease-like cell division protein FtsX [Bacillota bacterium]